MTGLLLSQGWWWCGLFAATNPQRSAKQLVVDLSTGTCISTFLVNVVIMALGCTFICFAKCVFAVLNLQANMQLWFSVDVATLMN